MTSSVALTRTLKACSSCESSSIVVTVSFVDVSVDEDDEDAGGELVLVAVVVVVVVVELLEVLEAEMVLRLWVNGSSGRTTRGGMRLASAEYLFRPVAP